MIACLLPGHFEQTGLFEPRSTSDPKRLEIRVNNLNPIQYFVPATGRKDGIPQDPSHTNDGSHALELRTRQGSLLQLWHNFRDEISADWQSICSFTRDVDPRIPVNIIR